MPPTKTPVVSALVPIEFVERRILLIRGQKVMLDRDLAELYGVETKVLNQTVRRNVERFPADFMFQLTGDEASALRSQSVTLEKGRGEHTKYAPLAFTELGVAMLSSVLRSRQAVQMNILIMRAFVRLREVLTTHKDLSRKIEQIEGLQKRQGSMIMAVVDEIKKLKDAPQTPRRRIGFVRSE